MANGGGGCSAEIQLVAFVGWPRDPASHLPPVVIFRFAGRDFNPACRKFCEKSPANKCTLYNDRNTVGDS